MILLLLYVLKFFKLLLQQNLINTAAMVYTQKYNYFFTLTGVSFNRMYHTYIVGDYDCGSPMFI